MGFLTSPLNGVVLLQFVHFANTCKKIFLSVCIAFARGIGMRSMCRHREPSKAVVPVLALSSSLLYARAMHDYAAGVWSVGL